MRSSRNTSLDLMTCSLHIAESFADSCKNVVAPWIERVAPLAWQSESPSLVIAPTRGHINAIKAKLTESGTSHLGLRFVTPPGLRSLLARDESASARTMTHLRLILAIAATEIIHDGGEEDETLAAKAVARSPGALLRALDRLGRAGWNFAQLQMPAFVPVVEHFHQLRGQCGFHLPNELERSWLKNATDGEARLLANVLITGFDGAHWPHWILLQAAVAAAKSATIVLEEPRGALSDTDLLWIGSWEETAGEANRAQTPRIVSSDTLFSEAEMRGEGGSAPEFDFHIGANAFEQAEAVAWQCIHYLADESCTRLGIVFPARGALSRLVAHALARMEIPHNDGVAHVTPGLFESGEWRAWMELQRRPRLDPLLGFINTVREPAIFLGDNLSRTGFEKVLRDAYAEVLLDDLDILGEFCAQHTSVPFRSAAAALRAITFLPARGTFLEFVATTETALRQVGRKQEAFEIGIAAKEWPNDPKVAFSRSLFLRWLEEIATTSGTGRAPAGDHPYARVQLLTVPDAQAQSWSHLILAGWNEGAWPPPAAGEFAREEEIRAFNRNIRQLNKRAAEQGRHGEGHISVRQGHSLYLGPVEQRAIALRQFDALIECTSQAVTITASLLQEDAPERIWNPSECLTRRYLEARDEPLNEGRLKKLQCGTSQFVASARSLESRDTIADIGQTLIAFTARRDPAAPAGEYDFALRNDESGKIVLDLSVSDLEAMVSSPAIIWMKRYLGVQPPEDLSSPWAATTGKWVHRWLARIGAGDEGEIFVPFPAANAIDDRICQASDGRISSLRTLCESLGKRLPDWWTSGWLNARYLARHLGAKVAVAESWPWIAAELPVGRGKPVQVAAGVELRLRGQIDLIFVQKKLVEFNGEKAWIVDYKTGSTKQLKNSDLHDSLVKGTTLQLGLYTLILRARGAAEAAASILSMLVKKLTPQLSAADLEPHANVFADLAEMQRSGVFGMKGEIRPAFGYSSPYPLATLAIDRDVLEDKWGLTHPNLVLEKEEWETW